MKKNILFNAAKLFAPAFLIALFFTFSAKAVVTQIGTADSANLTDTLSVTVPAGSNRVLVVIVSDADATSVSSVDFGERGFGFKAAETNPMGSIITPLTRDKPHAFRCFGAFVGAEPGDHIAVFVSIIPNVVVQILLHIELVCIPERAVSIGHDLGARRVVLAAVHHKERNVLPVRRPI